jgi:hypothetical protein
MKPDVAFLGAEEDHRRGRAGCGMSDSVGGDRSLPEKPESAAELQLGVGPGPWYIVVDSPVRMAGAVMFLQDDKRRLLQMNADIYVATDIAPDHATRRRKCPWCDRSCFEIG